MREGKTQSTNQKERRGEITKVANREHTHKRPYTLREGAYRGERENAKHKPKGEEGKTHEDGKRRTHANVYILQTSNQEERSGETIAFHVDKFAVRPAVYKKQFLYTAGAPPMTRTNP